MKKITSKIIVFSLAVATAAAMGTVAYATHSWGGYHWARTANPFTLTLGDNVSAGWDAFLGTASQDWSLSSVLDTAIAAGQSNFRCRATKGRVEVCNRKYGNNGWLGIGQIWVSGSHITQGTVKLNDTYFNTATYNTPAWKQFVMCQEIGHTFGLDHQDEDFNNPNLGSCMDYTNDPSTNQHPNQHDYEMLEAIYGHQDSFATFSGSGGGSQRFPLMRMRSLTSLQDAAYASSVIDSLEALDWGEVARQSKDGKSSLYKKNLSNNEELFTFVIWAE